MTPEQRTELVHDLQGTCQSLSDALGRLTPPATEDDLTAEDHEAIDNEIFLCDICGWWCELSEMSGDLNHCDDCTTDSENEDDL